MCTHSSCQSVSLFVRPAKREPPDNTAKRLRTRCIEILADRPRNTTAERAGPRAALKRLHLEDLSQRERAVWYENARVDAILSPCRLSLPSIRSGIRCWFAFIGMHALCKGLASDLAVLLVTDAVHQRKRRYFPPTCEDILVWNTMFRSAGTWCNYLNYVKTGCILCGASTEVRLALPCFAFKHNCVL